MEKVSFKNSRGLTLVGILHRADSDKVIVMAHGFTDDKSSKGRFDRVAQALNQQRYNILRFDFSGCGESDDDSLTLAKEVDDLQSAIRFLESQGMNRIALYGHSLGSLVCLKSYSPVIETMVLTGALTGPMKYNWSDYYSQEQLDELKNTGQITESAKSQWRNQIVVDTQMLLDFEEVNQKQLLEKVRCPVLIIHGNSSNDTEEQSLLTNSKEGMKYLPQKSRLEIIEGATHNFMEQFDKVIELAKDWYRDHF